MSEQTESMREMLTEVKSNDFSRSQFESEKTARIASLSSALQFATGYEREQIMNKLNDVFYEQYRP